MAAFTTSQSTLPTYDFALYPSDMADGQASQFNPTTTNPVNCPYFSFLVPFDGIISNLTVRLDLSATVDINPSFTFTVYGSAVTIGIPALTSGWNPTGLALATGAYPISSGTSVTAAFQNITDIAYVKAGTILTVVVSSSGFNSFEIQPAHLSAYFRDSPKPAN
jgi:hypothetical protein